MWGGENGKNFVFQEDNDPKHASAYCRDYLAKKEKLCIQYYSVVYYQFLHYLVFLIIKGILMRMMQPPQSRDLNRIEQVWDLLDSKIDKTQKTSEQELWCAMQQAWSQITIKELRKRINTIPAMRSRCNFRNRQNSKTQALLNKCLIAPCSPIIVGSL